MNPDRKPLSPPTSPPPEEEVEYEVEYGAEASDSNCEDSYAPSNSPGGEDDGSEGIAEGSDDYDSDSGNAPSSPPTSIETMSKGGQNRTISSELLSGNSADGYRAPAVETEDEDDQDENQPQRGYFQNHHESGNDNFVQRKIWGSQWDDEDGEPIRSILSSPPLMARVQSQGSLRKSPAPGSPLFPARPRQNTNSAKSNLSHQFSRRSPASRGSSDSYDHRDRERDHREDQKKPPLVLLHMTLLFLPGAEEVVLRHLTPTTIERGVLIEHPRGDYNLLEELILDGLGLDEDFVEEVSNTEEPHEKTWEQALNITPVSPPKKAWQVRVYASNGLMTPGAWKRVWAEMERIDVEIWPRGYEKRSSIRSFGFGNHSRSTSTSNISAILPYDECATDDVFDPENDSRRKPYSGIVRRRNSNSEFLASSAPVPTSPGRARTPSTTPKYRRTRTRVFSTSANTFGLDFNRLLTPRAVMIGAGINLLLFLYFTIFRFINVSTWKGSISSISFTFGGNHEVNSIQVPDDVDERCPVEFNSEGCAARVESSVTGEDIVEGEQKPLVDGERTEDEQDFAFVADPEIGSVDGELDGDITPEHITTPELDSQLELELEKLVEHDQKVEGETGLLTELEPKPVEEAFGEAQEAEAAANVEVDAKSDAEVDAEAATVEEEVEGKSKYSFLSYFGGSN